MATEKQVLGSEILAERHEVTTQSDHWDFVKSVLIVEDNDLEGDRMRGTLHLLLGRDVELRRATTLNSAVDAVLEKVPDVVILDDYLKPADSATDTIPYLRRAGYQGHIIVVSGELDRQRMLQLVKIGATTAIHKDEVDSKTVGAALLKTAPAKSED